MDALDAFMRAQIEPLQYAAFFGALVVFGLLESVVGVRREATKRRQRWPTNFALTALNIAVLAAIPVSGVLAADHAMTHGIGVLNVLSVTPLIALTAGVLFRSFVSWAIHLAMHKLPLLWRVHRVHHTDTFLDVSTTVRFHPVEFLISTPVLVVSVVAMGLSPLTLLLYEVFDATMAVFTHANVRLPRRIERVLGWLLVTPDMHRIHHSTRQPETDSNYGATLAVWDRLFGTYRRMGSEDLATMELGLAECRDNRTSSFLWLLALPLRPARRYLGETA